MAIAYQGMTFADWNFYWGESVLFTKVPGPDGWVAVRPENFYNGDEEENYEHEPSQLLEDIERRGGMLYFTRVDGRGGIECSPMTPFDSPDWVTYEPPLGYFVLNGRLSLITCRAPRNRYKGLHAHGLEQVPPVDKRAVSSAVHQVLETGTAKMHNVVLELCSLIPDRMNNPFPSSWYNTIVTALGYSEPTPVILAPTTAFISEPWNSCGYLLHQGTLMGKVRLEGTQLLFEPRTSVDSQLVGNVNAWIKSRLMTTINTKETV